MNTAAIPIFEESAVEFNPNRIKNETKELYSKSPAVLQNQEIGIQFKNTFLIAENEIGIVSPWMNFSVVNESFIELVRTALSRGVKVKILYGIGTSNDERSKKSDEVAQYLKDVFKNYGNYFQIERSNTHVKLLVCDDKYALFGSFNFLSNVGDYSRVNSHDEAVDYITDKTKIAQFWYRFWG